MPLESLTAMAAWSNLRKNPGSRWPARSEVPTRLEPICQPNLQPSFKLQPAEKVFTVGSCFARNVEKHLARLGYNLPGREYVPKELNNLPLDGFMNKFTPQSMLNEFLWAFEPDEMPDSSETFLPQADGTVIDGQLMSKINVSPERAYERRQEITDTFRLSQDCRVVVFTLGLVEAWFDKKTGIYLNRALSQYNASLEPDRFELHVLSFEELYTATKRLMSILAKHGHPDLRILLTVSPVPLLATFTQKDVLSANTYSKSVLRTVAEHISYEFDQVDYFPSYESVTLSDRTLAWRDDLGHVRDDLVSVIVSNMAEAYARTKVTADVARKILPKNYTSVDGIKQLAAAPKPDGA
ncbi:GSCFA family protein [Planktotalea frisia]|uniref:GSCFA family protein n=2 Tax=Planktotalea frisia TaxID=696762 RepID=A0A1L9NYZ9_9RHOB|nr:GSCFA domain-containing protein [Planktotalea frisia]OJI94497.1 GSCFA family protein [Planktotalea frisia]PZX31040.1 GSCFA family protein [Planktotalea frisia]